MDSDRTESVDADLRRRLFDVAQLTNRQLDELLWRGGTPAADGLAGHEYLGLNVPKRFERLGIRRFIKCFDWSGDASLLGCNTPVVQKPPSAAWSRDPSAKVPERYAFFSVGRPDPDRPDNEVLHALLFDYSGFTSVTPGPTRYLEPLIRDYVVRVDDGSDDVLLGKAYLAIGRRRVFSNFFVLTRGRPLESRLIPPATAGR